MFLSFGLPAGLVKQQLGLDANHDESHCEAVYILT
jgi:hypothetical protein